MSSAQAAELERFVAEALASGDDHREHALPTGGRYVFDRTPLPGVTHEVTALRADGAVAMRQRSFAAGDTPPPAYPVDVPFVANRPVMAVYFGTAATPLLSWEPVDDPRTIADELVAASRRQGWSEPTGARPALSQLAVGVMSEFATLTSDREFSVHVLVREGVRRMIQAAGHRHGTGMVTLLDAPASRSAASPASTDVPSPPPSPP